MPLRPGTSKKTTDENFDEVRHGKQYAKTRKKHGYKVANKQMVAIVLKNKRKAAQRKRSVKK